MSCCVEAILQTGAHTMRQTTGHAPSSVCADLLKARDSPPHLLRLGTERRLLSRCRCSLRDCSLVAQLELQAVADCAQIRQVQALSRRVLLHADM